MRKLGIFPTGLEAALLLVPSLLLLAAELPAPLVPNLVANSDFEMDIQDWDGEIRWPTAGGKAFIDSTQGYQSGQSLVLRNADADFNSWISVEQKLDLLPEMRYEVEGYIKNRGLNADFAGVVIHYRNNKGRLYSNEIVANVIEPRSEWQRFSASFVAPWPRHNSYLMLALKGQGEVWFDQLKITKAEGTVPAYASVPHLGENKLRPKVAPAPFVRLERRGEAWWLVKSDGTLFWDRGVNWVAYPLGHEAELNPQYAARVKKEYPDSLAWAKDTIRQLKEWGFTSAAGWAGFGRIEDNEIRLAVTEEDAFSYYYIFNFAALPGGDRFSLKSASGRPIIMGGTEGFPDPFNPEWRQEAEKIIARAAKVFKDDNRFTGYFVGNEPSLASPTAPYLYNYIWSEHASQEFVSWLKARYKGDIARLNQAWSSRGQQYAFSNFDEVLKARPQPLGPNDPVRKDLLAFERHLVKTYIDFTYETIKKYDPNHLVISPRLETGFNINYPNLDLLARYDIVAVNFYCHGEEGFLADCIEKLRRLHKLTGRPIMITEWGGGKLIDESTGSQEGAYQEARARLYQKGIMQLASLPFVVGAHWHMLYDAQGYNFGLLNSQAEPYEALVKAAREANRRLEGIVR